MTNEYLTILILDKLEWFYDKELNPKRYTKTKAILAGDLINLILDNGTIPKTANALGIGQQTLNRLITNMFVPIFGKLNGGGETWKFKLEVFVSYKLCSSCHKLLHFDSFDTDSSTSTKKHSKCRECRKETNAISYKKDSTQEAHKRSYELHYGDIRARSAQYRVERAKRSVVWADQEKIKEKYRNCPKGMHVDHEIPLKGELVSGLHVYNNLQYLTPEDNIKKGNSFIIE